jgi:hypothetical protein
MAANSFRERIIVADKTLVESLDSSIIKTVARRMPSYAELQDFAVTQFPIAAVVGRLPVPVEYKSGRTAGEILQVKSELTVDIFVYLQDNENMDATISDTADELWRVLLTDPTRSRLCIETIVRVEEDVAYMAPFGAFRITCVHKYIHSTGGI